MVIDLREAGEQAAAVRARVCVVGAGIAGLTLAHRLMERGVDVVLLEAGGAAPDAASDAVFAGAEFAEQQHAGTAVGRSRLLGGGSLLWGGQLLPLPQDADWPADAGQLARYSAQAERLLRVDALPYAANEFFAAIGVEQPEMVRTLDGIDVQVSKWTPFRRRNLARTMGRTLGASERVKVLLHAQATEVLLAADGRRVEAVLVRTPDGRSLRVEAEQFVVAGGTVESSRLLLASRSVAKDGVGNEFGQVGLGFHDHLTVTAATLHGRARTRVVAELRPWMLGATTHSIKLAASAELRQRMGLLPVLAHVTLEEAEDSGVGVVRAWLAGMQRGELGAGTSGRLPQALADAVRLLWSAKVQQRRYVAESTTVRLRVNVAQEPGNGSHITLSDVCDAAGVPQARVVWRVAEKEVHTLRRFAEHLRANLGANLQAELALEDAEWSEELFEEGSLPKGLDDARHAMGGAVMGTDPRSSVVDAELRLHGVANLSVASAAVFPDGSAQLPTLPLMALALRLGDRLADGLD